MQGVTQGVADTTSSSVAKATSCGWEMYKAAGVVVPPAAFFHGSQRIIVS